MCPGYSCDVRGGWTESWTLESETPGDLQPRGGGLVHGGEVRIWGQGRVLGSSSARCLAARTSQGKEGGRRGPHRGHRAADAAWKRKEGGSSQEVQGLQRTGQAGRQRLPWSPGHTSVLAETRPILDI